MTLSAIDVVPGRSVGPFVFHTALLEVVKHLDSHHSDYGVVNVSTNADGGVVMVSRRTGLSLTFHPQRQLLESVTIYDLSESQLEVSYRGQVLSGEAQQPTFSQVYEVLGPTFQGQLVHETSKYRLQYPGIVVEFPIPAQFHEAFSDRGTHPTRLPNGATPVADRIIVRPTASSSSLGSGGLTNTIHPVARCGKVILGDTVSFSRDQRLLHFRSSGVSIPLGVFPEGVVRLIGAPPSRVFTKLDNRMRIHSKSGSSADADRFEHGALEERAPPYAFNYPLLGMDFIFNGHHHLHKVVLHNPQPSYQTYLRYHRCNYSLETCLAVDPWELRGLDSSRPPPVTAVLDPDFKWTDTHKRQAAQRGAKPLISSMGCSNGLVLKIYAFYGIVLYEMPSSTKLVKVLLVDVPPGGTCATTTATADTVATSAETTRRNASSLMGAAIEPVAAAWQATADETAVSEAVDELHQEGSSLSPVMREDTFANDDGGKVESSTAAAPPTITSRPAHSDVDSSGTLRVARPPSCDAVADDDDNSGSSLAPVAEVHASYEEDSDVVPLFSVPQPYQPLPQSDTQARGNGGEDLYEEDFVADDGSSRQPSPQSSSVPSDVSPYLHPARSPPTELFDEPWGQQSAAAAGGEDSQDDEQDGVPQSSVTLPPAAVTIKSANSSVSTTKSSSKKGKKKKR